MIFNINVKQDGAPIPPSSDYTLKYFLSTNKYSTLSFSKLANESHHEEIVSRNRSASLFLFLPQPKSARKFFLKD